MTELTLHQHFTMFLDDYISKMSKSNVIPIKHVANLFTKRTGTLVRRQWLTDALSSNLSKYGWEPDLVTKDYWVNDWSSEPKSRHRGLIFRDKNSNTRLCHNIADFGDFV
jgi:hypothetical protein